MQNLGFKSLTALFGLCLLAGCQRNTDPSARDWRSEMLSTDVAVRTKAVAEYQQKYPNAEEFLVDDLIRTSQRGTNEKRANALLALGPLGQGISSERRVTLVASLLSGLNNSHPLVRAAALRALGQLKVQELSPFVGNGLADSNAQVRLAALHAANDLALPSLAETVANLVAHDRDQEIVAEAKRIQNIVGLPSAIPNISSAPSPVLTLTPIPEVPPPNNNANTLPTGENQTPGVSSQPIQEASGVTLNPPLPSSATDTPPASNPARVRATDVYDGPFIKDAWAKDEWSKQNAQEKAAWEARELEAFCKENNKHIGCPGYQAPPPSRR